MKKLIDITTIRPPMTHAEKINYLVESIAKGDASFLQDEGYKKMLIDSLQGRPLRTKGRAPKPDHDKFWDDFYICSQVVRYLCENKDMPLYCSAKEMARNKYDTIEREYIFDKVIALEKNGYGSILSIRRALTDYFKRGSISMLVMTQLVTYWVWVRDLERTASYEPTREEIDEVTAEFKNFIKEKLGSYMPKE